MALGKNDLLDRTTARAVQLAPLSRIALVVRASGLEALGPSTQFCQSMDRISSLGIANPMLMVSLGMLDHDVDLIRRMLNQSSQKLTIGMSVCFESLAAWLEGDHQLASDIIAQLRNSDNYHTRYVRSRAALIEGDVEVALEQYARGIEEGEQSAIQRVQGSPAERKTIPEFYFHPGYLRMLEKYGLDQRSISEIDIPPLPF